MSKYWIIKDTREKTGWNFQESESCKGTKSQALETGDYSVEGLEDLLCIERKASVAELAANVTQKRFQNEIERMQEYKHAFIILEFSINDILAFPVGSNIPKKKWKYIKIKGPFILKKISEYQVKYNIHVIPCGNSSNAEYLAYNIMKKVKENEGNWG